MRVYVLKRINKKLIQLIEFLEAQEPMARTGYVLIMVGLLGLLFVGLCWGLILLAVSFA